MSCTKNGADGVSKSNILLDDINALLYYWRILLGLGIIGTNHPISLISPN